LEQPAPPGISYNRAEYRREAVRAAGSRPGNQIARL